MRYRVQAITVAALLLGLGMLLLAYTIIGAQSSTDSIALSVQAFIGLGLVLFGTLILFITPENIVTSSVANASLYTYSADLALIIEDQNLRRNMLHVPHATLGTETEVVLVLKKSERVIVKHAKTSNPGDPVWSGPTKILTPVGLGLMRTYESSIGRDFFEIDANKLPHLLRKAIVNDLQLSSGFILEENDQGRIEAIWEGPVIEHSCVRAGEQSIPEVCCLCSSIACALALVTGSPVKIEKSVLEETGSNVTTEYVILGEPS